VACNAHMRPPSSDADQLSPDVTTDKGCFRYRTGGNGEEDNGQSVMDHSTFVRQWVTLCARLI